VLHRQTDDADRYSHVLDFHGRCQNPGFFSIFVNPGDNKIYGLQHFEGDHHTVGADSGVAEAPENVQGKLGVVYLAELTAKAGQLEVVRAEPVNFNVPATMNSGVWNPSGGSVTPWRSHLGSEESEPDARKWAGRKGRYDETNVPVGQIGYYVGDTVTCNRREEVGHLCVAGRRGVRRRGRNMYEHLRRQD
jgi:hypothetical protein